jgi:AcrR family transcriptional regulator
MARIQKRTRETEQKILKAAADLFYENGYHATSVDRIAEHADVSKATVFARFGDKENLLSAVSMPALQQLLESTSSLQPGAFECAHDALLQLYRPWLHFFADHQDFARLFLNQAGLVSGRFTAEFMEICCSLESHAERIISYWQQQGTLNQGLSASLLAETLQGSYYNTLIYLLSGRVQSMDDVLRIFESFLLVWHKGADS